MVPGGICPHLSLCCYVTILIAIYDNSKHCTKLHMNITRWWLTLRIIIVPGGIYFFKSIIFNMGHEDHDKGIQVIDGCSLMLCANHLSVASYSVTPQKQTQFSIA